MRLADEAEGPSRQQPFREQKQQRGGGLLSEGCVTYGQPGQAVQLDEGVTLPVPFCDVCPKPWPSLQTHHTHYGSFHSL